MKSFPVFRRTLLLIIHQLGRAENRIERRADVMAHPGKETVLFTVLALHFQQLQLDSFFRMFDYQLLAGIYERQDQTDDFFLAGAVRRNPHEILFAGSGDYLRFHRQQLGRHLTAQPDQIDVDKIVVHETDRTSDVLFHDREFLRHVFRESPDLQLVVQENNADHRG